MGTSLGACFVFFLKKGLSEKVNRALTGFAAGVMTAASFLSLIHISAAHDNEQVTSHTGDVFLDFFLHPKAQGNHGNDSTDTDEDVYKRQLVWSHRTNAKGREPTHFRLSR